MLARGYHAFYEEHFAAETYERVWQSLRAEGELRALGAYENDRLVGIVHFLFHAHVWDADVCYVQDLFVLDEARGRGAGRRLLAQVEREARARGACRVYWMTQRDNTTARRLYDKIARHSGFIRYEQPL